MFDYKFESLKVKNISYIEYNSKPVEIAIFYGNIPAPLYVDPNSSNLYNIIFTTKEEAIDIAKHAIINTINFHYDRVKYFEQLLSNINNIDFKKVK
jgi:hypothetical protein